MYWSYFVWNTDLSTTPNGTGRPGCAVANAARSASVRRAFTFAPSLMIASHAALPSGTANTTVRAAASGHAVACSNVGIAPVRITSSMGWYSKTFDPFTTHPSAQPRVTRFRCPAPETDALMEPSNNALRVFFFADRLIAVMLLQPKKALLETITADGKSSAPVHWR